MKVLLPFHIGICDDLLVQMLQLPLPHPSSVVIISEVFLHQHNISDIFRVEFVEVVVVDIRIA